VEIFSFVKVFRLYSGLGQRKYSRTYSPLTAIALAACKFKGDSCNENKSGTLGKKLQAKRARFSLMAQK
jgi:hypothetical protein